MSTPAVIVFDVNETLSDMSPLARRLSDVGAPELVAKLWFASLLRDGFALAAAGAEERFTSLGEGSLRRILSSLTLGTDLETAIGHVISGFLSLPLHADVPEAVQRLASAGSRLVTLSNGSRDIAEQLLATASLRQHFERLLSVDDAGVWKPARGAYLYGARACSVDPADMVLVAVHPWDIDGATRAGMHTVWVNRSDDQYPGYFRLPEHTVGTLLELPELLS